MATDESAPRSTGNQPDRPPRSTERMPASGEDGPAIRPYDPADRDAIVDLYDAVDRRSVDAWFRWKYEENPYADGILMVVAEDDGEVVGTAPCFALSFETGGRRIDVGQPADLEIRPGSDRRGLESRLLARLESHCRDRGLTLCTNVASGDAIDGRRRLEWEPVGPTPTYYRLQRPTAMLDVGDGRWSELSHAARPLSEVYHRARERVVSTPSDVVVHRFDDVPVEQFASLAAESRPEGMHAVRDETFYGWRFRNPRWSTDAYLASRGGEPIAGAIVGTKTERDGTVLTCLFDVAPLAPTEDREDGLRAILDRLVDDRRESDLLSASGTAMPGGLLRRYGFLPDDAPPLSWLGAPTVRLAVPLATNDGHPRTVAGRAIADPSNWSTTFADRAW